MWLRSPIVLCLLALGARAVEVADPLAMIGFHEGAMRIVECKDGFLKGLEVGYVEDAWSFAEPFIGSVRLICSNKTLTIQHLGDVDDKFIFGRLDLKTVKKAECEGDLGVAGFKWRPAQIKNPDGAEMREAGLIVLCNRPGNAPAEVELHHPTADEGQRYSGQFSCKQVARYAGLPAPKLQRMNIWYNRKSFAGLEPLECA